MNQAPPFKTFATKNPLKSMIYIVFAAWPEKLDGKGRIAIGWL